MKVIYTSNNSGGSWWLEDKDWLNLEKAGWFVEWGGEYFCHSKFSFTDPGDRPQPCKSEKECKGHRMFEKHSDMSEDDRWLGCLAKSASKEFDSIREALEEFEKITGQDVSDEGCNCCGAPHTFEADGTYISGDDCLEYLYETSDVGLTKRELLEKTKGK